MTVRALSLGNLQTNGYVVWDDDGKAMIIDPANEAEKLLSLLAEERLTVQAVVLTHAHFDHMMAAQEVCRETGAPLYVGAADEPALTDSVKNLTHMFCPGDPLNLKADRLLHEQDTVTAGKLSFTVWETPGHTPGSLCLVGEDSVFSGDTLFCGSVGRVDFPGGNTAAMLRSLERLSALPDNTVVYPGHGPSTTIGHEKTINPYMK